MRPSSSHSITSRQGPTLLSSGLRALLITFLTLGCHQTPPAYAAQDISAVWANNGEDKVTRDELRASSGKKVTNSVWDGSKVSIFGGRNEVVEFNVIIEAASRSASNVKVTFNSLSGPSGSTITTKAVTGNGVFNWVGRNIELFYIRYLPVHGMSIVANDTYDERLAPVRFRRPYSAATGIATGGWTARPDHDKYYPDIAVPLELTPTFTISAGSNQSIWADVYIPKTALPGSYLGSLKITENGALAASIPVKLQVYNFALPDEPTSKTMLYYSAANINHRYLGNTYVDPQSASGSQAALIRDRHYELAHRHKISLIGDNPSDDCGSTADHPCDETIPRLNGSLFTAANGYDGPGVGVSNGVYSIGTYGSWSWSTGTEADMHTHTDSWADWFAEHAPGVAYFLYLIDEPPPAKYAQVETWAQWILSNTGSGRNVRSFVTMNLTDAAANTPSLDVPATTLNVGIPTQWQPLDNTYTTSARKAFYMYNGHRPASGSFVTEDDGVALREVPWGQYKKNIERWFYWESTYYNNYQGRTGETNVFEQTQTMGGPPTTDASGKGLGQTSWAYGNGDGVMFYPGTDTVYSSDSYGVAGPFASLRLKYWRRGIQDVDYLAMAQAVNPSSTTAIVDQVVPKVLWEYGVDSLADPTYVHTELSWSTNPDDWEAVRLRLATLIASTTTTPSPPSGTPNPVNLPTPTLNLPAELQTDAEITAGYPTGYPISAFEWSFLPTTPSASNAPATARSSSLSGSTYSTPSATAALGSLNVAPGYYQISVVAIDSSNDISAPARAYVTLVSPATAGNARVYPNPWRSDQNYPRHVTFDQLTAGSTVEVFTISGHEVCKLTASGTSVVWDLKTSSGDYAASGIYIYLVRSPQGPTTRGKLALVR